MNKPIPTKRRSTLCDILRSKYLRWRLNHVELDVVAHETMAKLARAEAEALRCELVTLGKF